MPSSIAQVYLKRAIAAGALRSHHGAEGTLTKCQQLMGGIWAKLVQQGLENKRDSPGWTPHSQTVLPDHRSVRTFEHPLRRWLVAEARVPPAAVDRRLAMLDSMSEVPHLGGAAAHCPHGTPPWTNFHAGGWLLYCAI